MTFLKARLSGKQLSVVAAVVVVAILLLVAVLYSVLAGRSTGKAGRGQLTATSAAQPAAAALGETSPQATPTVDNNLSADVKSEERSAEPEESRPLATTGARGKPAATTPAPVDNGPQTPAVVTATQVVPATPAVKSAGQVELWHGWEGQEEAALKAAVAVFNDQYPELTIQITAKRFDELRDQFSAAVAAGEGPDLIIAPNEWVGPLAQAGLIKPIDELIEPQWLDRYFPAAVDALRFKKDLYGLPVAVQLVAMYYNSEQVEHPAATLEDWLAQAAEGRAVALNTGFYHAFWGITAFGGRLFDENGRVVLDQGGFAEWLDWLYAAQDAPGMFLDTDYAKLKALFLTGEAAYYVDAAWAADELRSALGVERLAVAPLPAGPAGPAGPLLNVEALLFSSAAADEQTELALKLADFLTDVQVQSLLMQEAGHIPVNVHVDASADPVVSGFMAQARTAVPFPNIAEMRAVWTPGSDAYFKVLEGLQGGQEAAAEAARLINEVNGK